MKILPLSVSEAAENAGFNLKIVIPYTDIAALTTATAASIFPALNVATTFPAGLHIANVAFRVSTAFVFAPGTLVFSVGDGGDAARFIAASTDLKTSAYGTGAITKFPYTYNAADTLDITVTAGSGALTSVTAGELHIYLATSAIDKLEG